jgi:hypothetical protein
MLMGSAIERGLMCVGSAGMVGNCLLEMENCGVEPSLCSHLRALAQCAILWFGYQCFTTVRSRYTPSYPAQNLPLFPYARSQILPRPTVWKTKSAPILQSPGSTDREFSRRLIPFGPKSRKISFCKLTIARLDVPCLQLEIYNAPRVLCTIRRLPTHRDSDSRPCLFKWSAVGDGFVPGGFILLCHVRSADERVTLQRVEIPPDPVYNPALVQSNTVQIFPWTSSLWELKTGDSVSFRTSLPDHWERQLRPGMTYELLWPGAMISLWKWGTIKQHLEEQLRPCSESGRDLIVLPGGARTLLSADSVPSLPETKVSPEPVGSGDRVYVLSSFCIFHLW